MNIKTILTKSFVSSFAEKGVTIVRGLALMPILITALGAVEYGIWVFVGQLSYFFLLSDFGLKNTLGRFYARFRGQGRADRSDELFSTSLVCLAAGAVFLGLVSLPVSVFLPSLIKDAGGYGETVRTVFFINIASLVLILPLRMSGALLTGKQLYGYEGIVSVINEIILLAVVAVLALLGRLNLLTLAITTAGALFVSQLCFFIVALKLTGPWRFSLKRFSPALARDVYKMGLSSMLVTGSNMLQRSGIGLLTGICAGAQALALFSVSYTLITTVGTVINSLAAPFTTIASELEAREEKRTLVGPALRAMRMIFYLSFALCVGTAFFAEPFLRLVLGGVRWSDAQFETLRLSAFVMTLGAAVQFPHNVTFNILRGTGRHWYATGARLVSIAASFACFFIAPFTPLAFLAPAVSVAAAFVVQAILSCPPGILRHAGLRLGHVLTRVYLPGLAVGALLPAACLVSSLFVPPRPFWGLAVNAGVFGIVAAGMFVLLFRGPAPRLKGLSPD